MSCSTSISLADLVDERAYKCALLTQLKCICDVMQANLPVHVDACPTTITKTGHGFTVGKIVALISGVWSLALASTKGAVIVTQVIDANTFKIGLSGCLQDVSGVIAGESYVVSPNVAGAIESVSDLIVGEAFKPVGVGLAAGVLMVNMSPAHINITL